MSDYVFMRADAFECFGLTFVVFVCASQKKRLQFPAWSIHVFAGCSHVTVKRSAASSHLARISFLARGLEIGERKLVNPINFKHTAPLGVSPGPAGAAGAGLCGRLWGLLIG